MSPTCTRCFKPRDREPDTFVETFTDSAWCTGCLCAFEEQLDATDVAHQALLVEDDGRLTRIDAR